MKKGSHRGPKKPTERPKQGRLGANHPITSSKGKSKAGKSGPVKRGGR